MFLVKIEDAEGPVNSTFSFLTPNDEIFINCVIPSSEFVTYQQSHVKEAIEYTCYDDIALSDIDPSFDIYLKTVNVSWVQAEDENGNDVADGALSVSFECYSVTNINTPSPTIAPTQDSAFSHNTILCIATAIIALVAGNNC